MSQKLRLLVSPATRTQQTAAALGREFETVKEVGLAASTKSLLTKAGWPHAESAVLVVGHQPTLGEVAAFLVTGEEGAWSVKKGAVWWIANRTRQGEGQSALRCVLAPEML